MTAIIDYGVGNLFSLVSSLNRIKEEAYVTADPDIIKKSDRIILPGVGAFRDAYDKLSGSGLKDVLLEEIAGGKPVLGICLGMQLLFEVSYEYGRCNGLGIIPGEILSIKTAAQNDDITIPHMGWNSLELRPRAIRPGECSCEKDNEKKHPLFKYVEEGEYVYFVHSFCACGCDENTIAVTDYHTKITASVAKDNVMGCQFHPEKSGDCGLRILKAFCEMK